MHAEPLRSLSFRAKVLPRAESNGSRNGASGTSDIDGCAARVAARESGDERVQSLTVSELEMSRGLYSAPHAKHRVFRRSLVSWYHKNGRDLPWRLTRDPYRILVSEFMLQQTQVATVLPYYQTWLRRFPNFATLARASETDALHAWQGLGYYTRARNLRKAAKLVMERHRGCFPSSIRETRLLPGIGKYTAHALATF